MRKNVICRLGVMICLAGIAAAGCVKPYSSAPVGDQQLAFDAWVSRHVNAIDSTALGTLITDDIPAAGTEVQDCCYVRMRYIREQMEDGTITGYSEADIARQLGVYDSTSYYGPEWFYMDPASTAVGIIDAIKGGDRTGNMRVGGHRRALVPGWLQTNTTYSDKAAYVKNVTGQVHSFATIDIVEVTDDIVQWQEEEIEKYGRPKWPAMDSTGRGGIWYARTQDPSSEEKFPTDTIIYINYIGRLTGGKVFDTNIEKVAKDWGIYSATNNYTPLSVSFSTDSTALKMNGSSVIKGFSLGIWQMHPHEAGVALFNSDYGYGSSGSSPKIPGYAPLVFEIQIVDKP